MRAESGPMRFGEDWPGLFLRGDDAMSYYLALEDIIPKISHLLNRIERQTLSNLKEEMSGSLLPGVNLNELQMLKNYEECVGTKREADATAEADEGSECDTEKNA